MQNLKNFTLRIKQYAIWIADLNPRFGTEAGKTRPVAIIQTNLLNKFHPSVIVCPITTNVKPVVEILSVHLKKGSVKLKDDCGIMIDQIRAIDNKRLLKKAGELTEDPIELVRANLSIIFDI